jgi:hypothetical protein
MRRLAYEKGLDGMFSSQDTITRTQLRAFPGTIRQYIPILEGSFGAALPRKPFRPTDAKCITPNITSTTKVM